MAYKMLMVMIILWLTRNQIAANDSLLTITAPSSTENQLLVENGKCEEMQANLSLNFRHLGLQRVDADFANSPNVNCLDLEGNDIDYVSPNAFRLVPNLFYLNLARNNLSLANFTHLNGHSHLRTLILDENRAASATFEFKNAFPHLQHLYLRGNGLKGISTLAFAPHLVHLYLSSNNLGDGELSFLEEAPRTLVSLDLADNGIRGLNVSGLVSMRKLRLDGNRIERLSGKSYSLSESALVLEGAVGLQRLSLASNQLTSIEPDAFDDTRSLVYLDLSHNKIDSIRKNTFENVEHLRSLLLDGNLLSEMPDIYGPEYLEYLSLSNNQLKTVNNDSFTSIEKLKFLNLSSNHIRVIEAEAFAKQVYLEVLDLSNNRIVNFPHMWLVPMTNLKVLSVNGNLLKNLDDLKLGSIRSYTKLQRVNLQNNLITKFYSSSLFNTFRYAPMINVTLEIFDTGNQSNVTQALSNSEVCNCNCDSDNEVFI